MPKFKPVYGSPRVAVPFAPMIGVGFLLLTFYMLNLQLVSEAGNWNANLPLHGPRSAGSELARIPEIKVKLESDAKGNLTQLCLGGVSLGNGDRAFERLDSEILKLVGRPGAAMAQNVEVEIDADYGLRYEYILKTVSTCTGRQDAQGNVVRYVEKVKFAPPKKRVSARG